MIFSRFKYRNWKKHYPSSFMEYLFSPTGIRLRLVNAFFQKVLGINSNISFMVHYTSIVSGNVTIGKNVAPYFANSAGCYIQGRNGIIIGDNTMFAPGVKMISANHSLEDFTKHDDGPPIKIGNCCWLGTNSVILPGVELGDNVIVGAGSVVTKSFEGDLIIGGVPAKVIKKR